MGLIIKEGITYAGGADVAPATSATLGIVKPDNTTIVVDANGVISGSSSAGPFDVDEQGYITIDYDLI